MLRRRPVPRNVRDEEVCVLLGRACTPFGVASAPAGDGNVIRTALNCRQEETDGALVPQEGSRLPRHVFLERGHFNTVEAKGSVVFGPSDGVL